jgi:hypothetical protein
LGQLNSIENEWTLSHGIRFFVFYT